MGSCVGTRGNVGESESESVSTKVLVRVMDTPDHVIVHRCLVTKTRTT